MFMLLAYLTTEVRRRWRQLREAPDDGYTTETVLVTALLRQLSVASIWPQRRREPRR